MGLQQRASRFIRQAFDREGCFCLKPSAEALGYVRLSLRNNGDYATLMKACLAAAAALLLLALACCRGAPPARLLQPVAATAPVGDDADDPAIWVHPTDSSKSLILGTNKAAAPSGALVVFGLDGRIRQVIPRLDRPNNVDVESGLSLHGRSVDIAVVTERYQHRLRVFRIAPDTGRLEDISSETGLGVFRGEPGLRAEPMGIALYRRPRDGAVFAVVSRKNGPERGYLWEYRLEDDGAGQVQATKVREFGAFSGRTEIEAVAVDDQLGYVYYADEQDSIRKWHADPDHPDAGRELARLATDGMRGDREGVAIYARADGTGYLICAEQLIGGSRLHIYRREGRAGSPHDHSERLAILDSGADDTDGLDAASAALGPQFPHGLVIAMNSRGRNFLLYRWEDLARHLPAR